LSYAPTIKHRQSSSTTGKRTHSYNNNNNKLGSKSRSSINNDNNNYSQQQPDTSQHYQTPISSIQDISRSIRSVSSMNNNNSLFQPKLRIGQPGDVYEQEADRVAEKVMAMSSMPFSSSAVPSIGDRSKAKGQAIDKKCTACEMKGQQENIEISRRPSSASNLEASDQVSNEIIDNARSNSGSPLDANTKEFMESRFGGAYDFSNVRIHTDEAAAKSSNSVNALAYTVGSDIIFGEGQYHPYTYEGRRLLAHELTHVVQQQQQQRAVSTPAAISKTNIPIVHQNPLAEIQLDPKPKPIADVSSREAKTALIEDPYARGSMDKDKWSGAIDEAIKAVKERRLDDAYKNYEILYSDIAKLADVTKLKDFGIGINRMDGKVDTTTNAKPGLNFSFAEVPGKAGTTFFVKIQGGMEVPKITLDEDAREMRVAIVLYYTSFGRSKEATLGVMRHEMMHVEHNQQTLETIWKFLDYKRDNKGKKARNFTDWLEGQKLPEYQQILIEKAREGGTANSEVLAYVEGFMTQYHLVDAKEIISFPGLELLGAIENNRWDNAKDEVKSQAMGRIQQYFLDVLDSDHRVQFSEWIRKQKSNSHHPPAAKDFFGRLELIVKNYSSNISSRLLKELKAGKRNEVLTRIEQLSDQDRDSLERELSKSSSKNRQAAELIRMIKDSRNKPGKPASNQQPINVKN
jgi:Domain of unknown function (DUF4157)